MLNKITKKEYAEKCWSDDVSMQKYVESSTFEIVPLNDGWAEVEKSRIKKDFCFGYGMYGTATDEEYKDADSRAQAAKRWEQFHAENVRPILERIETLEAALNCDNSGMFKTSGYLGLLAIIAIYDHYYTARHAKAWDVLDSRNCESRISPEEIIKGAIARNRCEYRLATREEIRMLLDAEKRQLANFEKRLMTYWKRYGADKLNIWTYLVD